jgi:ABC-type branched-subunit amino acid transport system substrate-binding protein
MRLPPSDAFPMDMINSYMASQGIKKIGFIGDTSGLCTGNFEYFEGAFNGTVIAKEYYDQAKLTADKADEMHTKMIEAGVKVYFLCNYAEDDLLIKASAYKLGLNSDESNLLFAIWPTPNSAPDKAEAGAAKEELIKTHKGWTSFAASPVDTPLKTAYKTNLAKKTPDTDSWCEYAYDIVYFYAAALNTLAQEQKPFTGEYLKTQMLKTSIVGITGPAKLEPNGDRHQAIDIFIMDSAGKQVPFYSVDGSTGKYSTNTAVAPKALDTPVCDKGANGIACSGNGGCAQSFVSKNFPVVLETRCSCNSGFAGSLCESACHADNGKADDTGKCICNSKRWGGADCSQAIPTELNLIPGPMKALAMLMFSINMLASIGGFIWVFIHRAEPRVMASQPFFLYLLVIGCMISSSTIIPMGSENSDGTDLDSVNAACAIFPWLYSIGFCITFGTLFAKIWRIHKIFAAAAKLKRARVSIPETLQMIAGLLLLDAVILGVWTAQDPLTWKREVLTSDTAGYPLTSAGQCEADTSGTYLACIGALHALVMVYASYLCYKTRSIPTEFAGGKYVAMAMASNLQVFLLGVPVMVIVSNDPSTSFFVRSAIIFLNDFAVLAFIIGELIFSYYVKGNKVAPPGSLKTANTVDTANTMDTQRTSTNAIQTMQAQASAEQSEVKTTVEVEVKATVEVP